jgi:hypothetical protein
VPPRKGEEPDNGPHQTGQDDAEPGEAGEDGALGQARRVLPGRSNALLITLALVGIVAGLAVLWSPAAPRVQRVQDTAKAMGMIREALVARAMAISSTGSLPVRT